MLPTGVPRLGPDSLRLVPPSERPRVDAGSLQVGIVHLGIGAFHRGHQAVFTEDAMAEEGSTGWGICGVSERSDDAVQRLRPQDGLYSLLERDAAGSRLRVVGAVREALFAGGQAEALTARIADPATRIVTTTVTEKGYHHDPATGRLLLDDFETAADLEGRPPRTVVGQLVRALEARRRADGGPLTVLCCDNLPRNGRTVQGLVEQYCDLRPGSPDDRLRRWIAGNVAFPSSMVDRIVPATTEEDYAQVRSRLGLVDLAAVTAEPFRQWVMEDRFPGGRPAWERAGAILTQDVEPYEAMKLRLLNGSHSALAYLGALAGFTYMAEAVTHEDFAVLVRRLMDEDVGPTLEPPAGIGLEDYKRTLMRRWSNPLLRHRILQIAMDGSQKLPQRLLDPIRERLAAGEEPYFAALAVAGWMRFVWSGASDDGAPLPLDDPLGPRLRELVASADTAEQVVRRLLAVREVFGNDLADSAPLSRLLSEHLGRLAVEGARATVQHAGRRQQ